MKRAFPPNPAQHCSLIHYSSDLIAQYGPDARTLQVSPSVAHILGYAPQELIGTSAYALIHPDDVPLLKDEIARQLAAPGEPSRAVEIRKKRKDGRHIWVSANMKVLTDDSTGEYLGVVSVCRDVTSEVLARRQSENLAAAHQALFENSLDIIAQLDEDGYFVRINRAVRDVLGYEPEECVGRNYRDFLPPEEQERAKQADLQVKQGPGPLQDFEANWRRKDGSLARLSFSARWSSGEKGMYISARDVTARYEAKAVLQKSNARLSAILESIGDAFFALDANWRVTFINDKTAAFVGRSTTELIGQVMWEAVPEVLDSPFWPHYRKAMQTRAATNCEGAWQVTGQWLDVRIYPFEDGIAVYFHDASQRQERQHAIEQSERRFREMVELTPAAYIETDGSGRTTDVNAALCAISGYSREELLGEDLAKLFKSCPWDGIAYVRNGPRVAHAMEATVAHKMGHDVHVLLNGRIARDDSGDALGLTAFMTDITERKQAERRLAHLANCDSLTGLPNRSALVSRAEALLGRNESDSPMAVFFLDVDRFKEVNDSFGHDRGDHLLREVAARLSRNLRPMDFVARIGGDEFVVMARCTSGREAAEAIAGKLLRALSEPIRIESQDIYVSASIGISMFPADGRSREQLFQNADIAMYRAKAAGRNCFRFFSKEMASEAKIRLSLDASLRRALPRKEFCLVYQPRIDLATMQATGVEALIRWRHPELGLVSPARFIPIAEANGLIEPIGAWVLEEACRDAERLGRRLSRPLRVSVNVSAVQFRNPAIVETVERVLQSTGLRPPLLELELTESALIEDIGNAAAMLGALKALGVGLSLDDFGTGYSALTYLRRFPMDILKLDRSFLLEKEQGYAGKAFVKAFVDMAHALGMSVVAEGVESKETLDLLGSVHCDEVQGFYLAPPMPYADVEQYLAHSDALQQPLIETSSSPGPRW